MSLERTVYRQRWIASASTALTRDTISQREFSDMKLSLTRDRSRTTALIKFRGDRLHSLTTGGTALEKPGDIVVRPSTDDNVPAMLAIYAHHIQRAFITATPVFKFSVHTGVERNPLFHAS
jgi:hypothetical protein